MRSRATGVLLAFSAFFVFGVIPGSIAHAQTSCFSYAGTIFDPTPPFDTEWSQPVFGVEDFTFNGTDEYVAVNLGNEMGIWRLVSPTSATAAAQTSWHPTPVDTGGSVFHALRNIAVCDGCRYGHAAFRELGQIVFDLGTGSSPTISYIYFGEESGNPSLLGGAMYRDPSGQEYLLSADLENGVGTTIYEVNGLALGSSLNVVGTLTLPGGGTYSVRGGEQYGHYLYLMPASMPYEILILDMSDPTDPNVTEWVEAGDASVDTVKGYLAVTTGLTNPAVRIYDISASPMAPELIGSVNASPSVQSLEINYPYLFGANPSVRHLNVWDITVPGSATSIDEDYWNNSEYDHNSDNTLNTMAGAFHSSGEGILLARYSELQIHGIQCTSVQPTAGYSLSPGSGGIFPGDTVTVTNTSTGPWTRSAVWVTDQDGEFVQMYTTGANPTPWSGNDTVSEDTPTSLTFDVPNDVTLLDSFTVHVAVGSDEFPYNPQLPGDQYEENPAVLDRTPEATFTMTPVAPITGATVTLEADAEGHPQGVGDAIPFTWKITPPGPAEPFQLGGESTQVELGTSGRWLFDLVVDYMHEAPVGAGYDPDADGMYEAEAEQLEIPDLSSVAACFSVSPTSPSNTDTITLNASCSNYQQGATVSYDWTVSGPTNYTGCEDSVTCQIPADTLDPGSYTITLTLTNTANDDTDSFPKAVQVQDGSVQLVLSGPSSRSVGQSAVFSLGGAPKNSSVTWSFGGPSCDGDPQTQTCTYPGDWDSCADRMYVYSTEGTKTVTATVSGVGSVSHEIEVTSGSCSGSCSYSVTPTSRSFGQAGGSGGITVQADSGCAWSATSSATWLMITGGSSGTGSGTVSYQVAANSSGTTRYGTISVEDATFTVTQTAGTAALDFSFSPTSPQIGQTVIFEISGLSGSIDQAVWNFGGSGCSSYSQQTTCTPDSWTECTEQAYKYASAGEKTVTVNLTVGGSTEDPITHTLTVQDSGSCDGGACNYGVSPTSISAGEGGETGTIQVTTTGECQWTAESNNGWIQITSGSSGTGSGSVGYSIEANYDDSDRQGSLTVAGRTVTVSQAASSGGSTDSGPMMVPAVASVPGLEGTNWKSDLRIFNPRDEELTIDIRYIPEPGDDTPYPELTYHPDSDQTIWIDDIMYWFTQGAQAKGALIITYEPEDGQRPLIASRTFNQTETGTYGQLIPVLGSSSLAMAGGSLIIPGVEHNENYRSNLGLVNSGEVGTGVTIQAINESGLVVAENSLGVPAGRYMQLSLATAVGEPELTNFRGSVIVQIDNGGPLAAYVSIVDQLTGDPVFDSAMRR